VSAIYYEALELIKELKAENARLKAECQARQAENSVLAVECDSLKAEVERLTKMKQDLFDSNDQQVEHIERLTRAGDAMASIIKPPSDCDTWLDETIAFNAWCKAKGVKP